MINNTKKAVYAGSFDPITLGHLDIIQRASKLCDNLVVAIGNNLTKSNFYSLQDRVDMVKAATQKYDKIEIVSYDGLLTDFMCSIGAELLIRGIRNTVDFEQEKILYAVCKCQMPQLQAIYLMSEPHLSHISSTVAKELQRHSADAAGYLSQEVILFLKQYGAKQNN